MLYIGKAVCNEKCMHGLGRDFVYLFNKEVFYSIRLVPGSSPGQPILIIILTSYIGINRYSIFLTYYFKIKKKKIRIIYSESESRQDHEYLSMDCWLTRRYKSCYTVE